MPKDKRPWVISTMIYTVWNLWKERNRRNFEGKSVSPRQVLNFIKRLSYDIWPVGLLPHSREDISFYVSLKFEPRVQFVLCNIAFVSMNFFFYLK
jgi:hypothetical protein